mmetsp:Transcript_2091/g.3816  ORF Transcript_2091/g.3816 Transcript_2091/m.3816 type:complete len:428 (-) Transcript_2091:130-1413(-)
MLQYDNESQLLIIFRMTGSVLPSSCLLGLLTFALGTVLAILRKRDQTIEIFKEENYLLTDDFFRIACTVVGFLLVMRTNQALNRWMHAVTQVEVMLSKWSDAYNALNSFFSGKDGTPATLERILLFRIRVAHWFSLMSCLAFATLRAKHLLKLEDVPIRVMFPEQAEFTTVRSFTAERKTEHSNQEEQNGEGFNEKASLTNAESDVSKSRVACLDLLVLAEPTEDEIDLLLVATDKVNAVYLWIIQGISEEIRAKTLDAPPPIVSRVFQEISNGKLGFCQAHKVAMVPFPFPFAQMVSSLLVVLYILFPIYLEQFTANKYMTAVLAFIVPLCYCGLNRVAVELEEPFGTDWNDVDIEVRHEEFLWMLIDVLRQATLPPWDETDKTVAKILDGCSKSQRLCEPKIFDFLAKHSDRKQEAERKPSIASG